MSIVRDEATSRYRTEREDTENTDVNTSRYIKSRRTSALLDSGEMVIGPGVYCSTRTVVQPSRELLGQRDREDCTWCVYTGSPGTSWPRSKECRRGDEMMRGEHENGDN